MLIAFILIPKKSYLRNIYDFKFNASLVIIYILYHKKHIIIYASTHWNFKRWCIIVYNITQIIMWYRGNTKYSLTNVIWKLFVTYHGLIILIIKYQITINSGLWLRTSNHRLEEWWALLKSSNWSIELELKPQHFYIFFCLRKWRKKSWPSSAGL